MGRRRIGAPENKAADFLHLRDCIAAILFQVAYNMSGWPTVVHVVKRSPESDIAVLVLTFFLTVVFDLVAAISVGLSLACLLFMRRMTDVAVSRETYFISCLDKLTGGGI